jgi:hypothetical protein
MRVPATLTGFKLIVGNMKLKLTNKTTKYITSKGRESFAFLDWIGLITLDDGREGQLAYNYETKGYICLFNTNAYEQLDTQATQKLVDATKGRLNAPKERPRPMRHYMISLPDDMADGLRMLGSGNLSAGVRECYKLLISDKL